MTRALSAGAGVAITVCAVAACAGSQAASTAPTSTATVTISGGHRTNPVDNGRPVKLVASSLGVPAPVFRYAFSKVTPAGAGEEPDPAQVALNKQALLDVLAPYGVTNDSLDRASDHYRYNGAAGELWPTEAAVVKATIVNGAVTGFSVVSGGSGYTTAPTITVAGHPGVKAKAKLAFSRTFARNGRISAVTLSSTS
jgi:hypothetical protein